MADNFDPDAYLASKQTDSDSSFDPDAYLGTKGALPPEAADHGLSERQKLSPIGKALSPVTEYWPTYQRMKGEAEDQVSKGLGQIAHPGDLTSREGTGLSDILSGAANTAIGAAGFAASPISAAYRSIIGQPIEDTTGIPREWTETAAQLATPGIGLTGIKKIPEANFGRAGFKTEPPPPPAGNDVVEAADRVSKVAPAPVNVPKAFASDNVAVQRAGQLARNVPLVGDSIPRATGEMANQLGDAVNSIASHYGEGSGPNVANRISNSISDAADAERAASTNATKTSDDALLADWQRSQDEALHQVGQHESSALEQARQSTGHLSPQDMGQTLIDRLRTEEQAARAHKDELYNTAGNSDASVRADSVQGVHGQISNALNETGRVIDPTLTPAANSMMNELERFSNLQMPNRVGPAAPNPADIVSVDARGMEQTRKRLGNMAQAATNDADRAASRIIMRQFDDWQAHAYDNALFSGSPEALQSFRDARAANASWRQRFYNNRDDADRLINRIVTGEVTPQEISNWLVGNSQVGSSGVSSRLLTRIGEATGNDQGAMDAIRGGVAHRLFGTAEGATARTPEKIANDIHQFFNGSGRDVANRLFTPEQRRAALDYANTLRRGQEARQDIATVASNTKPTPMSVGPGPMQELASASLGKSGKSDETLFNAIDAYARSGGRADVQTLADIVRHIPEKDRGDLAGAIIRKLGQSDQAKGFSPEKFATEWAKYTPPAKTVLFGNAGAHRQALDDIATISQRYKEVGRRFGNPSGTGQTVLGFSELAALYLHPFTAIPALIGGAVFARMLSAPATAAATANVLKSSLAMAKAPNPLRLANLSNAASAFAKAAQNAGSNLSVPQFMRQLAGPQGPGTSQAQELQQRADGGAVGDDYNTALTPEQETGFQTWKSQNAPDDSGYDYDLRGAYLADMQRSPDNGHMGDRFKKPNHPTFSDQSQYAVGDQRDRAGSWVGPEGPDQTFVPPVATKAKGGRINTVPESNETLVEQQKQLLDGSRNAQLFPKGKGELKLPKGIYRAKMPNGDIFHYAPKRMNAKKLLQASKTGHENDVLGLGPITKHEAVKRASKGEHPVAIVERTPKGVETRAAAGTHATMAAQLHTMAQNKSAGNFLSVEHPWHTLAKRRLKGYADGGTPISDDTPLDVPDNDIGPKHVYMNMDGEGNSQDKPDDSVPTLIDQSKARLATPPPVTDDKEINQKLLPELPDNRLGAVKDLSEQEFSKGTKVGNKLFGTGDEERYQTWPERMIRSGLSLPHDVMTGETPTQEIDPTTGEVHTSGELISRAQDMAGMAGGSGLMTGATDATLGSAPFLRPALKYGDKIYKAPVNGTHLDAIPEDIYPEFQKQAMNGDDISNFNFGFMNHKGQFLDRAKALDYAVEQGLVGPHVANQGALTSTLLEDSSVGAPLAGLEHNVPKNVDWQGLTTVERNLSPEAARTLTSWVGGDVDAVKNGATYGLMSRDTATRGFKDPAINSELQQAFQPLRDQLHQQYGDTITLYRHHGNIPEGATPHDYLSFTTDKDVADNMSGAPPEKPIVPEATIAAKEAEFAKNGKVQVGPHHWLEQKTETFDPAAFGQPGEPKEISYIAIMGPDGMVTDTDSVRSYLEDENAYHKEYYNDVRAKRLGNTKSYQIPVDDIVAATDRFRQKEFIVKNSKQLFSDSSATGAPLAALEHAQPFYSAVEKTIDTAPQQKMHGVQWANWLKNQPGVKPDELQYTGIDNWLREQQGPVTKQQVQDYIGNNKVQVNDIVKGGKHIDEDELASRTADYIEDWRRNYRDENGHPPSQYEIEDAISAYHDDLNSENSISGMPKYSNWQLPGGENYREHLLTLPNAHKLPEVVKEGNQFYIKLPDGSYATNGSPGTKSAWPTQAKAEQAAQGSMFRGETQAYRSSHWDEPNVVAHMRTNDRDVVGVPAMHIEELQSDWHQAGRKNGYQGQPHPDAANWTAYQGPDGRWRVKTKDGGLIDSVFAPDAKTAINQVAESFAGVESTRRQVPDAPFKTSWPELAMKRMIQKAVEENKSRISWTPGEAQAARYDLSKHFDEISANPSIDNGKPSKTWWPKGKNGQSYESIITDLDGNVLQAGRVWGDIKGKNIADVVGKDIAEKGLKGGPQILTGVDLKVGGQGMKGFYDQMLPKIVEKLGKQYGVKVKEGYVARDKGWNDLLSRQPESLNYAKNEGNAFPVHYFDIPPKMKEDILKKGFPLFSDSTVGGPLSAQEQTNNNKKQIVRPIQEGKTEPKINVPGRAAGGRVLASNIDANPSEAQKHAGNYKKDHINLWGLNITIENAKNSIRRGVGPDGKAWAAQLPCPYGYLKNTNGADNDHLDVYIGPHTKSDKVFVINQINEKTKEFDETKSLLGFGSLHQALTCYKKAFSDGKGAERIGSIVSTDIKHFKEWVKSSSHHKPFKSAA